MDAAFIPDELIPNDTRWWRTVTDGARMSRPDLKYYSDVLDQYQFPWEVNQTVDTREPHVREIQHFLLSLGLTINETNKLSFLPAKYLDRTGLKYMYNWEIEGADTPMMIRIDQRHVVHEPDVWWDERWGHCCVMMLDLDNPDGMPESTETSLGAASPWMHWLITDAVHNSSTGNVIYGYNGPTPLGNNGEHRYMFLVLRQNNKTVNPPSSRDVSGLGWTRDRSRWPVRDFLISNPSLELVAVNYFKYDHSEESQKTYNDILGSKEESVSDGSVSTMDRSNSPPMDVADQALMDDLMRMQDNPNKLPRDIIGNA